MAEFGTGVFEKRHDDEGRRPEIEPTVVDDTVSIGAPGVAIYGGTILEQEKDSRLTGTQKYNTYAELLVNNPIVSAGTRYFLNIASGSEWKIQVKEELEDDEKAKEIANSIHSIMHDMVTPWHRIVRRALMFRFYGFSVQVWTAKLRDDGVIGYKDIAPRAQRTIERWDTNSSGEVLGVVQRSPQTGKETLIPRRRMIYIVDDSLNDSPEGLGIFRHLVKLDNRLRKYELLEGWGFERDLRGTPIGRAPLAEIQKAVENNELTKTEAARVTATLELFISNALKGKDTGMVLDSAIYRGTGENNQPSNNPQWSVVLLKGETTSQEEVAAAIERVNREIARLLGVEQLLLGSDSRGSHALSQDKTQAFGVVIDSAMQELARTLEKDFFIPLFEMNGWDTKYLPTFRIEKTQFREVGDVVETLKNMALAGAPIPLNDPVINEVRRLLGLSDQPEQDLADLALLAEATGGGTEPGKPGPKEGKTASDLQAN